jgi:hypothetical protein
VVLANEDLNLVLVAAGLERGRRLARDVLVVEEELREGALGTEEGVLIADSAYELLLRRLVYLTVLE